jgi:hypothetical protein
MRPWRRVLLLLPVWYHPHSLHAKLADRSRLVQRRQPPTAATERYVDQSGLPIEGTSYHSARRREAVASVRQRQQHESIPPMVPEPTYSDDVRDESDFLDPTQRHLSSQLSGCCYNYQSYSASSLCSLYGDNCESGETPSHDSGDGDCTHDGLSFIGISFSVNTASGNPYSYQLCDQFPMENIIDRDYEYVMSMDEDGWLVGGGYKTFDYSGKMP